MSNIQPISLQSYNPSKIFAPVAAAPFLDTLAQLTPPPKKVENNTKNKDKDTLLRRARSKYFTQQIAIPLAELRGPLEKYYRNACYCNHELIQHGEKITGKYCNTRICNNCNRIRTAKMINGYRDEIEAMQEPRFVTLTIPNVSEQELPAAINLMYKRFRVIMRRFTKAKIMYAGIRKLEGTYNAITNMYHPHFHIIINGNYNAYKLLGQWFQLYPEQLSPEAQDIKPVDENCMIELFKYASKIVDTKKGEAGIVYINAVDVIMKALHGRRIIQPFGSIKKNVSEEIDELRSDIYEGIPYYEFMTWEWYHCDWVNEYGELLTGYEPCEVKNLVIKHAVCGHGKAPPA